MIKAGVPHPASVNDREAFSLALLPKSFLLFFNALGPVSRVVLLEEAIHDLVPGRTSHEFLKILRFRYIYSAVVTDQRPFPDIAVFIKVYFHAVFSYLIAMKYTVLVPEPTFVSVADVPLTLILKV